MGTIKKGILGGVSGKIGNVVGGSWKGIDYLRVLPASVSDAKSPLQKTQRNKFAVVMKFLQPLTEFIRIGFKGQAVKQTAFNAAMSYNYHNALTGEYPDIAIDYANAAVSQGNLPAAVNPVCASDEAAKVSISWDANTNQGHASDNDVAMAVVYNPILKEAIYVLNAGTRADATISIDLPNNFSGNDVHCYVCFMVLESALVGGAKNAISNSAYAGSVSVI